MLKVIVNSLRHGIEHQRAGDPKQEQPARTSIPSQPANLLHRTEYQLLLAICVISAVYSLLYPGQLCDARQCGEHVQRCKYLVRRGDRPNFCARGRWIRHFRSAQTWALSALSQLCL